MGAKELLRVGKRGSTDEENLGPVVGGRGSQFLIGHRLTCPSLASMNKRRFGTSEP